MQRLAIGDARSNVIFAMTGHDLIPCYYGYYGLTMIRHNFASGRSASHMTHSAAFFRCGIRGGPTGKRAGIGSFDVDIACDSQFKLCFTTRYIIWFLMTTHEGLLDMPDNSTPQSLDLSRLRIEYMQRVLEEHDVDVNPIRQFLLWLNEAISAGAHEPNAMTLATCAPGGFPSARIVLLKGIDDRGFAFFTNYLSRKGRELDENPRAALVFYWPEVERQVRVEGDVSRTSRQESQDYFASRPAAARIGSASSPQSQVVESRQILEARERDLLKQYPDGNIPCPAHWGGYRVRPIRLEFWQGRPGRLHDRIEYLLQNQSNWLVRRLAP